MFVCVWVGVATGKTRMPEGHVTKKADANPRSQACRTSLSTSADCGSVIAAPCPCITSSTEPSAQYSSSSQSTGSPPSGPKRKK
eukprot:scaffold3262_cov109-Isochrysis_galbana.AAC.1